MATRIPIYLIAEQRNDTTDVVERFVFDGEGVIPIPRYTPSVRNHLLNHASPFLATDEEGIQEALEHIEQEKLKGHIDKRLKFQKIKVEDV